MTSRLYEVLQVPRAADAPTLRTAYRRAALLAHPDKGGSKEKFHLVALAFDTLSKQVSREVRSRFHSPRDPQTPGQPDASSERMDGQGRPHTGAGGGERAVRARRSRHGRGAAPASALRKSRAVGRLRSVLQSLDGATRREAVAALEPQIQRALLAYMLAQKAGGDEVNQRTSASPGSVPRVEIADLGRESRQHSSNIGSHGARCPQSGVVGVHRIGAFYRASVAVANLEIYSGLRPRVGIAIDEHIILMQLREAILLEIDTGSKHTQQLDENILKVCRECLAKNGTSEREIQLRAKVRVRATQWIGSARISSPTLPFETAIRLRSRLLRSKQSSWQSFRAECIALWQGERCFHGKRSRRTPQEAEAMAEKGWANAASRRLNTEARQRRLLNKAVRRVAAVLELEERRNSAEKARARAAAERKAAMNQRWSQDQLRKWYRRSDLTMEEIIRGPPAHLRQARVQNASG